MNAVDPILADAVQLPLQDRAKLADRLRASLEAEGEEKEPGHDQAWAAEIEARSRSVAEGRVERVDADEFMESLRRRIEAVKAAESVQNLIS